MAHNMNANAQRLEAALNKLPPHDTRMKAALLKRAVETGKATEQDAQEVAKSHGLPWEAPKKAAPDDERIARAAKLVFGDAAGRPETVDKVSKLFNAEDPRVLQGIRKKFPELAQGIDNYSRAKGINLGSDAPDLAARAAIHKELGITPKKKSMLAQAQSAIDPANAMTPYSVLDSVQQGANLGDVYARVLKGRWAELRQKAREEAAAGRPPWQAIDDPENRSVHIITAAGPTFTFQMDKLEGLKQYQQMIEDTGMNPADFYAQAQANAKPLYDFYQMRGSKPGEEHTRLGMLVDPKPHADELHASMERIGNIIGHASKIHGHDLTSVLATKPRPVQPVAEQPAAPVADGGE